MTELGRHNDKATQGLHLESKGLLPAAPAAATAKGEARWALPSLLLAPWAPRPPASAAAAEGTADAPLPALLAPAAGAGGAPVEAARAAVPGGSGTLGCGEGAMELATEGSAPLLCRLFCRLLCWRASVQGKAAGAVMLSGKEGREGAGIRHGRMRASGKVGPAGVRCSGPAAGSACRPPTDGQDGTQPADHIRKGRPLLGVALPAVLRRQGGQGGRRMGAPCGLACLPPGL